MCVSMDLKITIMCLQIQLFLYSIGNGFPNCSSQLEDNWSICFSKAYLEFNPDDKPNLPVEVQTYLTILDFVEIDWNENTITLFLQMMARWKDSRIVVKNE